MEETTYQESSSSVERPKKKFPKKLLVLVLVLVLIGGLLYFGSRYLGSSDEESTIEESTEFIPTAVIEPTVDESTQEPTPEEDEDTSPTPKPTGSSSSDSQDEASGLDRADLTVEVQNGSGVAGVASEMGDFLTGLGYKLGSTGNADNFDYENIEIRVTSAKKDFLPLLKSDIGKSYTVGNTSSNLTNSSSDALIIVGK